MTIEKGTVLLLTTVCLKDLFVANRSKVGAATSPFVVGEG